VSRSNAIIPNEISKAICNAMNGYDIGILGFCLDFRSDAEGIPIFYLKPYHGNDEIIDRKDVDNQIVFVYLVVKESIKNKNYATLIPLNDEAGSF
jgi:hypothetical protein